MVGMTSRELTMKALPVLSVVTATLAFCSSALAHCGMAYLKLEQAISRAAELRQSAKVAPPVPASQGEKMNRTTLAAITRRRASGLARGVGREGERAPGGAGT